MKIECPTWKPAPTATLAEFSKKLCANVLSQLQQASLPLGRVTWRSINCFRLAANGAELTFWCYVGDQERPCCLVDVLHPSGKATTMQLVSRRNNPADNPEVVGAMGTKLTIVEVVS